MKLLYIVALSVCALTKGTNVEGDISSPGFVTKEFERSQYDLNLVAPNLDETKEVVLSDDEAEVVEAMFQHRLITGAIEDILEQLRTVIIYGNDDVPPLDPYVLPVAGPFEYRITGIAAEGTIHNLRMEGLRWFVADRINANPIRLTFGITLTVPWVTVTGQYDTRARIGILVHRAGGNFRIFAHRIEVGFDMRMGTNIFGGGHLVLRQLDVHIDIHDTHISITGMTGSSLLNSLISNAIQNVTQDFIQSEMENVSRILSEELFDVINDVLKDYTVSDIFG